MEAITPSTSLAERLLSAPPPITWHVVGAAVQGVSHARLNLPCQDAQGYRLLPDGTLLVAVADGAGSARFSEQGADCAIEAALRSLSAAFEGNDPEDGADWERRLRGAFGDARGAVVSLAALSEDAETTPRDYAATLTCVVASAGRLAVGQVGDGAVIVVDGEGSLFAATRLQRGEYANETHFISEEDALEQMAVEVLEMNVAALAVMSDGLIRLALKMPAQQPHAPFFQPLFRFASSVQADSEAEQQASQQLAEFLTSERVNARTDDDKSLVLAVREGVVLPDLVSKEPLVPADLRFTRESLVATPSEADTIETVSPLEAAENMDDDCASTGEESRLDREGE